jgi:hypothetical protein
VPNNAPPTSFDSTRITTSAWIIPPLFAASVRQAQKMFSQRETSSVVIPGTGGNWAVDHVAPCSWYEWQLRSYFNR